MSPKIKKLARLTAEGDEGATKELARELVRGGFVETEGEAHWVVKDVETGKYWGQTSWSNVPHLYTKIWALNRAKKLSEGRGPFWRDRGTKYKIEIIEIKYVILQKETV